MSDYGHHPNEIHPTLRAIREKYSDKKLFVVFQPHQYSRTRELLQEFAISFNDVDTLIIPNIYFSRDKKEDVEWMTMERLIEAIERTMQKDMRIGDSPLIKGARGIFSVIDGKGLENTVKLIREYDSSHPNSSVILLLGAGDIDGIRDDLL